MQVTPVESRRPSDFNRGMRRHPWLVAAALVLGGCGSFEADMKMMCESPNHVSKTGHDPSERAMLLAEHITKNTKSREARELFQALGNADADQRVKLLEYGVKRAGIDPAECPMLTEYR
jgi:hypothetical protein